MDEKLTTLLVFRALVLGYPLGKVLSRFVAENRMLFRLCGLAGAVMSFVGLMGNGDIRYLILAEAGLYLQIAWLVASFKSKRTNRAQYQELWASRREANPSRHPAALPAVDPDARST